MHIYSPYIILTLITVVLISWFTPKKFSIYAITLFGVLFLSYYDIRSLIILVIMSFASYHIPKKYTFNTKVILVLIFFISLTFIVFKAIVSFNNAKYLMPLGLSFYSFRVIHYIFEGYKQKLPKHNFKEYLAYLFFLPTFIVGPINRFQPFVHDLRARDISKVNISYALERILYGYAKIIILSSYIIESKFVSYLDSIKDSNQALYLYLSPFEYWFNLYFQFSGYSDIAIGFSALMGFKIIENFNYPFLAKNISEFWQRWHISLSKWIKDYVYVPIVSYTRNPFLSILLSLIIFGLWHEFSLNYILWGLYHAIGISIWHKFQRVKKSNIVIQNITHTKLFYIFSILLTLHFVVFSFEIREYILNYLHL